MAFARGGKWLLKVRLISLARKFIWQIFTTSGSWPAPGVVLDDQRGQERLVFSKKLQQTGESLQETNKYVMTNWDVRDKRNDLAGAPGWLSRLSVRLCLAQVMISWFVGSSSASSSVLTAQSLEPASDSVSPCLSAPPPLSLSLSLSKINKH